jgi:hypothetical protein
MSILVFFFMSTRYVSSNFISSTVSNGQRAPEEISGMIVQAQPRWRNAREAPGFQESAHEIDLMTYPGL